MGGKVLLLMAALAAVLKLVLPGHSGDQAPVDKLDNLYKDLFSCQLTLSKNPDLYKVELKAFNLILPHNRERVTSSTVLTREPKNKLDATFEILNITAPNGLHQSTLDPSLPFSFFINGFNHHGAIEDSWMEGAANAIYRHANLVAQHKKPGSPVQRKSNVIFLAWRVSGIITLDTLSMPMAYYRTMANYDIVMDEIARVISHIVDFIEETQGGGSWQAAKGGLESARSSYYSKFEFYGHSLGSHLMSNAIELVHQSKPWIRFGKLVGLDPALPCFIDENHGLSADKLNGSVSQVMVVHSNAAFSGVYTERGNIDIVLNGGTFQPGCHWLDFTCSHVRSNDIFTYMDDQCEMVAYWCSKYEQFKYGACDTCDEERAVNNGTQRYSNCVLVNLPEQYANTGAVLPVSDRGRIVHLDGVAQRNFTNPIVSPDELDQLPRLVKRYGFHFVNTDPNFLSSNTHCLQHYQVRLLVLTQNDEGLSRCPLSSYYLDSSSEIQIRLLYETAMHNQKLLKSLLPDLSVFTTMPTASKASGKILTPIVYDRLYTGLVTFSGKPKLFVGTIIDTINLKEWSRCLVKANVSGEIEFKLDIAFMSSTKSK